MAVKKTKIQLSNIPVKVPIPERITAIQDKEKWKQAVREWWRSTYATRYEGYRVIKIENELLYMQREE
ncbi:hypothetical protein P9578_28205 [Brevibacillus choshinensis]|uniref:hypothetical protein n=1 Tax=Brevibacillus choshinensis TaxID=54911 RepID=UPI002E1B6E90|nr:hypothetical protein [Brevibacillus choshinensis]